MNKLTTFNYVKADPEMKTIRIIAAIIILAVPTYTVMGAPDVDSTDHVDHVATDPDHQHKVAHLPAGDSALAHQLAALRDKVAQLETQLSNTVEDATMKMPGQDSVAGMAAANNKGMKMDMMDGMAGMKAESMNSVTSESSEGMNMGSMGMMQMNKMKMFGMMGMKPMMGSMQGMGETLPLPGFPGASHLYHLGATGFFLNHGSHISLTTEQTAALNKIKERATLSVNASERSIEKAEEELWQLTSLDQPDILAIESKVDEIAKLQADKRIAFIRAVGEAGMLLTDDQRKSLTGFAPPSSKIGGM